MTSEIRINIPSIEAWKQTESLIIETIEDSTGEDIKTLNSVLNILQKTFGDKKST